MPILTHRRDVGWNEPLVDGIDNAKYDALKRVYCNRGLVVSNGINVYVWSNQLNCWCHLVSQETMIQVNCTIENDNASVNFGIAFGPYVNYLYKHSVISQPIPTSVCIGTERLEVSVNEHGDILFTECRPLVCVGYDIPRRVAGLAICPVFYTDIPGSFRPDNTGQMTQYIRTLFPDEQNYQLLQWFVGNCIYEPIYRSRMAILWGPGGTGKSTVINAVLSCMKGVGMAFDDDVFTVNNRTALTKIKPLLMSNRLLTSSDVVFDKGLVNMRALKQMTGGDTITVPPLQVQATCSVMIGANKMPTPFQEEWLSLAIMRRIMVIPMTVNATMLPQVPPPYDDTSRLTWLLECLSVRMSSDHPPISTESMLLSICGDMYEHITEDIQIHPGASLEESLDASAFLALSLGIMMHELGRLAEIMSPRLVRRYANDTILINIALKD